MRIRMMMVAMIAVAGLAACGGKSKGEDTTAGTTKTLYDRLGGKDGITAVVEDFVANVGADNRINAFFQNTDLPKLKQLLVDQICEASGGPCKYAGRSMQESHTGLNIKKEHFTALVEDLVKALDKYKVAEADKQTLLGVLGPMEKDIVTAQ